MNRNKLRPVRKAFVNASYTMPLVSFQEHSEFKMASAPQKDAELTRKVLSFGISVEHISDSKGRGLVAQKSFKKSDFIFEESPLICAQFAWNMRYKYTACDHCLRSLESAQEMARRLSGNTELQLPYPECCEVAKCRTLQVTCPQCQVC